MTTNTNKKRRRGRPRKEGGIEATKTLDRGLYLLEQFDTQPMTLVEICQETDLHPSTASRLLRTLTSRGYLAFNEEKGQYSLGPRMKGESFSGPPENI